MRKANKQDNQSNPIQQQTFVEQERLRVAMCENVELRGRLLGDLPLLLLGFGVTLLGRLFGVELGQLNAIEGVREPMCCPVLGLIDAALDALHLLTGGTTQVP